MNKYYYILDDYNRFHYISDIKRDDMTDLLEIESNIPLSEIKHFYHCVLNGEIVIIGQIEEDIKSTQKNEKIVRIGFLKTQLLLTDYQVIKCYEAQILNEPMPYNLEELLAQRKAWRDEINAIEFELTMLG